MGMPYGYNNSPYGMGQNSYAGQNPYAGYNTAPQQAPQASLSPEQIQQLNMQNQYLAQQNAQELGTNVSNAALLGGVVGAGVGAVGVLNGEEGNLKQQYTYKQGGKEYQVTLKDKGASNPVAKRFGAKSDDGGRAVKSLVRNYGDGKKITYEFLNYYKGDINTPTQVRVLIHDGSSSKPTTLVFGLDKHNALKLNEIILPTSTKLSPKRINPEHLRLDPDLLSDIDQRRKNAKNGWLSNRVSNDLGKRQASLQKAQKEIELARNALGDHYAWVENLAKNGLKEGVDFPNLGKVAREARVDKALDWSGMLKNIAKGGGLGLLIAGAGAGLLTLLTQQRPAYARQSNPTPNQGFRPY